jgi:RNA polymerase sigma factor (sigma-70 family)
MNSTAARNTRIGLLAGRSPLLRLQSDERLIALIRSGHEGAFALLFERYRPRLLSFCRHMLASKEDAEDVLQEVFAASYNAIRADNRPLNVRPWLYRIARNRCLNHLRRPTQDGRDTMDDQTDLNGASTADLVHSRAEFRHLLHDIQTLPETQRTALLLREIDVLSYEQIADTMETTVPSVKSLLVRARMSLAEAAEARQLTCNEVRRELAEVTEGLKKTTAPLRRHVRQCDQCKRYRKQLNKTTTAMAITLPLGPLLVLKKLFLA